MSEETLLHLFCECEITREFWDNVCNWLSGEINTAIQRSFDIYFGFLLNQLILIEKKFIFQCKIAENMPTIGNFKFFIKDTETVERHIALQNNRTDCHNKKGKSVLQGLK